MTYKQSGILRALCAVLLSASASACSLIPGTAARTERQAREVLSHSLFDGDSARLQNVRPLVDRTHGEPPISIICGEVNAKNKMGAYVGYRRFVVVPAENFANIDLEADETASDEDRVAQKVFDDAYKACESGTAS